MSSKIQSSTRVTLIATFVYSCGSRNNVRLATPLRNVSIVMQMTAFSPLLKLARFVLYSLFHLPMIVLCREADVVGGWHVTCSGRASPCLQVFTGARGALRNMNLRQENSGIPCCTFPPHSGNYMYHEL
jgi:hypothetical protein